MYIQSAATGSEDEDCCIKIPFLRKIAKNLIKNIYNFSINSYEFLHIAKHDEKKI